MTDHSVFYTFLQFVICEYFSVFFQMEYEKIQSEKLTKTLTDKRSRRQRKVLCMLSKHVELLAVW